MYLLLARGVIYALWFDLVGLGTVLASMTNVINLVVYALWSDLARRFTTVF